MALDEFEVGELWSVVSTETSRLGSGPGAAFLTILLTDLRSVIRI